ncbi:unnamed protein product, partial [Allacma fusca]
SLYTSSTAKEAFQQLLDLAIDGEDFKIIQASLLEAKEKILAKNAAFQAFPMSTEVRNQPANKNAEKQQRIFVKKQNKIPTKSIPDRSTIMRSLLPLRMHTVSDCVSEIVREGQEREIFSSNDIPVSEVEMPVYSWKPNEHPVIPPPFVPARQPLLPQNLRFTRADVVFEQAIDWWSSNAPATYVDPRENCRTRVKREVGETSASSEESTYVDLVAVNSQHEAG